MRASDSAGRPTAGWIAAAAAAFGVAAWLLSGGVSNLRSLVESPETGVRRALGPGVRVPPVDLLGAEGRLRIDRVRFAEPLVKPVGDRAEVVAVADGEGTVAWRGAEVKVSFVARERLALVRCAGGWCPEGPLLPRVGAVLSLLSLRAAAFDDGAPERYPHLVHESFRGPEGGREELLRRLAADLRDGAPARLDPVAPRGARPLARLRPIAWQLRLERETAEVGEDYEISVGGAPRRLRARFALRDDGGIWRFTEGL